MEARYSSNNMGKVIWFCGLSGSGKTTIASGLKRELKKNNRTVKILDGDDVRDKLHRHLSFTPDDIRENNRLISIMCQDMKDNYDYILVPVIAPFQDARDSARKKIGADFLELFVNAGLDECIRRDEKGYYKKAFNKDIRGFIGIETPFEPPINAEIVVDTKVEKVSESIHNILVAIDELTVHE